MALENLEPPKRAWIDRVGQFASTLQSLTTIAALLVGALWTYWLFIQNREQLPRAKVEHAVQALALTNEDRLLRLNVTVENSSKVLLGLQAGDVRIQQMAPLVDCDPGATQCATRAILAGQSPLVSGERVVRWPLIAAWANNGKEGITELEPGERETLAFDFVIPSRTKIIQVYSYFANAEKEGIGWKTITIHDLDEPGSDDHG